MFLLIPTDTKKLSARLKWFKKPIARRLLAQKNIEFGFELKGEQETIKEAPPLYWAYHLPVNTLAECYYHSEKKDVLFSKVEKIAKLKPAYINVHGIELWWRPKAKNYIKRYENRSQPKEYQNILASTISLYKSLKKIFPSVTLENTIAADYYRDDDDKFLPETSYQTSCGTFLDLCYLKEKKIEILLDLEHMILTLNFLYRKKNYRHLEKEKVELNLEEEKISQIFGYKIKKEIIPYADEEIDLAEMIRKIGAKHYHVTGSTIDIVNDKDVTHGPIKKDDQTFRRNLRTILAQKPETILLETVNSNDNACYHYLRPNETELSFYNLCQILLEEL